MIGSFNTNVEIAKNWRELNQDELIRLATLSAEKALEPVVVFFALLQFKWWRWRDWVMLHRLRNIPAKVFEKYVKWALKEPSFCLWKIKSYGFCYGPDENLNKMSWQEFTVVDGIYLRYQKTGNWDLAIHLAATLMRGKGIGPVYDPNKDDFRGDVRKPFNTWISPSHYIYISTWPKAVINAIVFNYEAVRRAIEQDYPRVFSNDNENQSIVGPAGWKPITISIAGRQFGTVKETNLAPFKEVLTSLELNAMELEKLKDNG